MADMTPEERVREWSGKDPVQQVFMDGYFTKKNTTWAATCIFEAMEIMKALIDEKRAAVQAEREACAQAAEEMHQHKTTGGSGSNGTWLACQSRIAAAIRARGKERNIQEERMDAHQFGEIEWRKGRNDGGSEI